MLLLRPEDLSEGLRSGVTVWQRRRNPGAPPDTVAAFEDLLLVRGRIRYPAGCDPTSEASWREGVRVVWAPRLFRYLYMSPVPVSDLRPAEALGPSFGVVVHFRQGAKKADPLEVVDGDGRVLSHFSQTSSRRLDGALGPGLRWRLADLAGWPTLLAWRGRQPKLRAVAVPIA